MSRVLVGLLLAVLIAGCGGGGGGTPQVTVLGRVLQVATGGPPNPAASVQSGGTSTLTALSDGSFSIQVSRNTAALLVDPLNASGTWTFAFAPVTATTDIGDLWIGPERVRLQGRVVNSTNNLPVPDATVSFAGRSGTTNAAGQFDLADVAYSSATQTAFWGIAGTVRATGFFASEFSAQPNLAAGGIVTVTDVLLTPSSSPIPPGPPYNVWGRISPSANAPGTVVTAKLGGVTVRLFNVGADGTYRLWLNPGTYVLSYANGALSAPDETVVLTTPNQVIQRDVLLQ